MPLVTVQDFGALAILPVVSPAFTSVVSFTRPNDSGSYAAGDTVADLITTGNAMLLTGLGPTWSNYTGQLIINSATLRIDTTGNAAQFASGISGWSLHLYGAAPSGIADNLPFSVPTFDRAKYLGYIALPVVDSFGTTFWSQNKTINFITDTIPTAAILQTRAVYIPGAGDILTVNLRALRYG